MSINQIHCGLFSFCRPIKMQNTKKIKVKFSIFQSKVKVSSKQVKTVLRKQLGILTKNGKNPCP